MGTVSSEVYLYRYYQTLAARVGTYGSGGNMKNGEVERKFVEGCVWLMRVRMQLSLGSLGHDVKDGRRIAACKTNVVRCSRKGIG